jgi:hypothetical protein
MESNCMKYPQELINSLLNCTDEAALMKAKVAGLRPSQTVGQRRSHLDSSRDSYFRVTI